jgi:hypothetical protein
VALEDRVKELEEELKVLKNEIQTTLLDIQEQILSHYYPSLYPSANKEANLAQAKVAHPQAVAEVSQNQAAAPLPRFQGKYQTQTITLVEEPEEDEGDESEPLDEEDEPVRLAIVPQKSARTPKPAVNGHVPNNNKPLLPPSGQALTAEDEAFLDAIVAKGKDMTAKDTAVSFDEFKDLMAQKTADTHSDEDLLTEDLLNELLKDSMFALNDENLKRVTELPDSESMPEISTIDKLAVKSTVRKLLQWVDESITVIGKNPTKQAIAMYVRAGDLSEEMHRTLLLLVDSSHVTPATDKAGIRQIIDTLGELNDILDHHTPDYLNQVMRFIMEVNFG